MYLWPAFLLGLLGSLHCAGMCGPLVLALPQAGGSSAAVGRIAYNLGRLATYTAMGLVFGLIGESLVLAGLQRWASILAGVAILIGVAGAAPLSRLLPVTRMVSGLKRALGSMLRGKSSMLLLGSLNGLLPCGLVYVAGAGAVAAGGLLNGAAFMLAFGVGTVPMMFSLGVGGRKMLARIGPGARRWIPAALALLGAALILRGMALGIPYLSPELRAGCCH